MNIEKIVRYNYKTISPYTDRKTAIVEVLENDAVVVSDENTPLSVLTPADLVNKPYTLVIDCLEEKPVINSNTPISEALKILNHHKTDASFVKQDDNIIGILLKCDILDFLEKYSKELEKEIQQKKQELEEINKKIEKQIELKTKELEELNKQKDLYLSILAHDLKQPFISLIGFSDLIIKNIRCYDKKKIEGFTKLINLTAQNTYFLLEDLLLWSKAMRGEEILKQEKVLIKEVFNAIINKYSTAISEKKLNILYKGEENIAALADYHAITAILRNLISNAIKFSHENGRIIVQVKKRKNDICISIKDEGVGIESERLEKLWDKGKPVSTQGTHGETGTGFGLIICKELVEQNNGKIWAESTLGKGSCFYVALPACFN